VAALSRITQDPIRPDDLVRAVLGPDRGAIATFAGVVRDHHAGRAVLRLEYHAYAAMAERVLGEIAEETGRRFGTPHVAIVHRIGRLAIGETSVLVAVAAAHRREALAACAFAIDRVKELAPIWKKEYYADGAVWIEGPESEGACGADP
jgi:molybdopterin synthase catalytic subunit